MIREIQRDGKLVVGADVTLALQMKDDLVGSFLGAEIVGIDAYVGVGRLLVRVRDAGELFDDPGPSLGVHALSVSLLADLEGSGDMDQYEPADLLDHGPHLPADPLVGSDRGTDGDSAVLRYLRRHEAYAQDVDIAMLPGETKLRGKILADDVSIQ